MYTIKVIKSFSGAHSLREYKGKCESVHGHNWKIEALVSSPTLSSQGMLMDFTELKRLLIEVLSELDHKNLNDLPYFKKENPTSENISRFIHNKLSVNVKEKLKVIVWETDTSCASFEK